jgi:hypothetical protein|tara:strand:+ start:237 stop:707 length:471 start_codon:yes stop_codon:yes gene_type:complete
MEKLYIRGLLFLVLVGLFVIGYLYFISTSTIESQDESPLNIISMDDKMLLAKIISEGAFVESAHHVNGKALIIEEEDGSKILRFEDFDTINGPNLHIYLSNSLGNDDFIDLGNIRATKGNVNYDVPQGTDLEKYDKVLVWCVPFGVLFSYSDLEEV